MNKFGFCLIVIQFLTHNIICLSVADDLTKCEVGVALPWESNTFIAEESSVHINCTTDASQNPGWTIQLPGRTGILQFTFQTSIRTLNDNGFYQLSELDIGMNIKTSRLLINNTTGINGTVVRCDDIGTGNSIIQTKLIVYEPTPVNLLSEDVDIQMANISWNPSTPPVSPMTEDINQTYTLTVTSNNVITMFQLHQPYFVFTAPDGAPPCEVYNFSVTATYVGATYTGPGCSEPSPVLSRMLPSLPDIQTVESSIKYSLEKCSNSSIVLSVSFVIANACSSYPVIGYFLDIQSPVSDSLVITPMSDSMETSISAHNLIDNSMYTVNVIVISSQCNLSTNNKLIYTTDVQKVTAVQVEDSVLFQCEFVAGSDAQGCLVVLVGRSNIDNVTNFMNLTEINTSTNLTSLERLITFTYPLSCYRTVHGYDIESDGSVGTLAVPGQIINTSMTITGCNTQTTLLPSAYPDADSAAVPLWTIGIILPITIVKIALLVLLLMIYLYKKRFKSKLQCASTSSSCDPLASSSTSQPKFTGKDEDATSPQTIPLYAQPQKQNVTIRTPDNGADKSCNHRLTNADCTCTEDHNIYHVIENQGAPPVHKLDSSIPKQSPIYQEVAQVSTSRAEESTIDTTPNEVYRVSADGIETTPNEVYGVSTDGIETTPNEVYGVSTDGIETTPNEVYGVSTDGIETTPNAVYGVSTDGIVTTPNEVYGVSTDGIETTPNEVYGVSTDGIETTPNEVYGVSTDGIETTPNAVYGVSTDGIVTTLNEVYGVSTDGIETTPNEVYGVSTDGIKTTPNEVYGVSTDNTGIQLNQ